MYCLFAEIDPDRGTAIAQAIQTHTDRLYQTPGATDGLTSQQVRAQAVYELITRTAADEPCRHEVLVLIDHRSAVAGLHPDTVCETAEGVRLPVPHVRALCATATITAAVLDATGAALAVGRDERIATRPQRRALRAMYRTCAFPGCDVPFDRCHVHHVEHWEHGGSTDLANLLPLCHRHHHLVHDGGWRLTIDHQRTLRWHRPDGTLEHEMPFEPLLHCGASTDRPVSPGDPPPSSHHEAPPTGRAPPSPTAA